jgi:hypothetical protein
VRDIVPYLELLLALISGGLAILLLAGKIRIEIVYRPKQEEAEEDEVLASYVAPLEKPKSQTLIEGATKRKRGRPKKVQTEVLPVPPAL